MDNYGKGKKIVILTFHRSEILYEVTNLGYVTSDVMPAEDEHSRHQTADICEDGNVDRVTRIMNLSYQECVDMLYSYTKADVEDESTLDNTFGEPNEYVMRLFVPLTFSKGTVALLKNLIHEYIVDRIMYDWFSISMNDKNESLMWHTKSEEVKTKIEETMNTRGGRIRRTQTPF